MNKYFQLLKKYSTTEDYFEVVLRHSLTVLGKSIEIINKKNLYNKIDFDLVVSGCLLHDIGVFGVKNSGIGATKRMEYLQHGIIGGKILRKEGLSKEALIAERHIGSGLSKGYIVQYNIPIPKRDFLPLTLEQKLICYADKFHSKSGKIDTLASIKEEMKGFGEEPLERFLALEKLFE